MQTKIVVPDLQAVEATLADVAPAMRDYVDRARKPADWRISDQFSLVLIRVGRSYCLTTCLWCRQPNPDERRLLRQYFAVPDHAEENFDYDEGWSRHTLIWKTEPPPEETTPEQLTLFTSPPAFNRGDASERTTRGRL